MGATELSEAEFLQHVIQAGPRLMWFLGAGSSRSSGVPTATDITWDLKRRYYCAHQNQDVRIHDVTNKAVQARIQSYLDSKGFPPLHDPREYSFYFEQTFGADYAAQQKYLREVLATRKASSTIGHRVLAALLHMGRARIVFTTNFDEVAETAYSAIAGHNLPVFHLEGSYAALEALNAEQFPIYAKVHGDFRYQSLKNLSADLRNNDEEIQRCFVAAATRFGVIVAGYSGRDANVMSMFRTSIGQSNAFPHGLFWTTPRASDVAPVVHELIVYARSKGIRAAIVVTGTFDEMLSKIWRFTHERPAALDLKVRSAAATDVSVPLPPAGKRFPILRTNALLVSKMPSSCGAIEYTGDIDMGEVRSKLFETRAGCTVAYTDRVLFWGGSTELEKILDPVLIRAISRFTFHDLVQAVGESGFIKAFVEETLGRALVDGKPLSLRRAGRRWYAVVKREESANELYQPLQSALGYKGSLAQIHGKVPGLNEVYWAEAVAMRVEERNGALWLLLRPDIWISPLKERENAADFLRAKKLKRYNSQAFDVLSAWIELFLGDLAQSRAVAISAFPSTDHSAQFAVLTRTAYSRWSGVNG